MIASCLTSIISCARGIDYFEVRRFLHQLARAVGAVPQPVTLDTIYPLPRPCDVDDVPLPTVWNGVSLGVPGLLRLGYSPSQSSVRLPRFVTKPRPPVGRCTLYSPGSQLRISWKSLGEGNARPRLWRRHPVPRLIGAGLTRLSRDLSRDSGPPPQRRTPRGIGRMRVGCEGAGRFLIGSRL